jgi:hypothetical protein
VIFTDRRGDRGSAFGDRFGGPAATVLLIAGAVTSKQVLNDGVWGRLPRRRPGLGGAAHPDVQECLRRGELAESSPVRHGHPGRAQWPSEDSGEAAETTVIDLDRPSGQGLDAYHGAVTPAW